MSYNSPYLEYFRTFSRGDLLALIAIVIAVILFIGGIIFAIWWDLKKKREERFREFKETFLPFIEILKNKNLPHGAKSIDDLKSLFATQDIIMLKIKDRLKGDILSGFTAKWNAYKKEQENFKEYLLAVVVLTKAQIERDDSLLNLINEILEIAKNN